jgi:hypothetical protein
MSSEMQRAQKAESPSRANADIDDQSHIKASSIRRPVQSGPRGRPSQSRDSIPPKEAPLVIDLLDSSDDDDQ